MSGNGRNWILSLALLFFTLAGLRTQASLENYQRAERFLPGMGGIRFMLRA
jgi:hypothetical protein